MKKRRQISQQAKDRKILDRNRRRAHTLEVNETRAKGVKADNATLLAQLEAQYEAGEISLTEYNMCLEFLGKKEVPDDAELGF